jgi:autotransporter-associated beta strand protein
LVLNGTNTFTGVLNVDTAQPSAGNDGAVYLASPGALNGASGIAIRNENAASSTLQLDGLAGNLNFAQAISLNGRNNSMPAIENITGTNTLAGNISLGVGGGSYTAQSDSGELVLGGVVGIQSLTSGRTFTFQGTGDIFVAGVITNGSAFANSVFKAGAGTLTLAGTNSYSGATTNTGGQLLINGSLGTNNVLISGGTLGGGGVIRGAVTVQAGGALSPGNAVLGVVGALTINNSLALGGTTLIKLNKAAATNDSVRGVSAIAYSGTLTVTNLGGTLADGDSFKIFYATNNSGSFATLNLPALGAGLAWNTTGLANGVLSIVAVLKPQFGSITQTGDGNFQFGGVGSAGVTYELDAATNLVPPVVWNFVTNTVAGQNGNFQFADLGATNFSQRFYRISANQ